MKTLRICQENYEFARKKAGTPRQFNNIPAAPLETEGATDAAQAPCIAVFPSGPRFPEKSLSCALVQFKGCFRAYSGRYSCWASCALLRGLSLFGLLVLAYARLSSLAASLASLARV